MFIYRGRSQKIGKIISVYICRLSAEMNMDHDAKILDIPINKKNSLTVFNEVIQEISKSTEEGEL